jgi:flagellar assembly protein FliH
MSSRILRGDIAGLNRFHWNRVAGPEPDNAPPEAAPTPAADIETIREMLRQEFESRFQAERSRLLESGREMGRNEARQQLQPQIEQIARSLAELARCRDDYRREAEREVVQLALEIARRVIRRELSIDPEAIVGLLRAALESVSMREVLEVRVHPSYVEAVRSGLRQLGAPEAITLIGDGHLEPGAVLVETRRGSFDASADTQLDEIQRGFADIMERNNPV